MIRKLALGAAIAAAALPAAAQTPATGGVNLYPQISGEADLRVFSQSTVSATERRQRGTNIFSRGELAAGLFLSPEFSIQGVIVWEPVGEVEPNGGTTGFRYQAAYTEELKLDWRPTQRINLYAGKFSAPFGRGHHDFPGLLLDVRAHEVYLIRESVGVGGTFTYVSDARFGEHEVSVAAFGYDTSFLSETAFTRKRCCEGEFERYSRNSRRQGGPGNTGQFDNVAISLDGDNMPFLPNTSYHLALLSRGPGVDGTKRETGFAAGLRHEIRWSEETRTLLFGEFVQFRGAGGNPREEGPELLDGFGMGTGERGEVTANERRRFTTVGAQTRHGPWRATLGFQRDERKRSENPVPRATYIEASVGRDLPLNFRLDVGYQRSIGGESREDKADAVIAVLGWRASF
ncbi:hypothetical protein J8J14_09440 [Roseomonas sp. SSH11]|uniref:Porin n=1 Tax=Pararoseomonas baculiformis TaxID=2820812 RepID=A0ABS4ADB9_9PROT|nr:hypothetical protein [Pararoseomonas baculiformis]MBP0445003.1 hypothetical protein [Pararoseomonas baculiformis]